MEVEDNRVFTHSSWRFSAFPANEPSSSIPSLSVPADLPWRVHISKGRLQVPFHRAQHWSHKQHSNSPSPSRPAEDKEVISLEYMIRPFSSGLLARNTMGNLCFHSTVAVIELHPSLICVYTGELPKKENLPLPEPHGLILHLLRFIKTDKMPKGISSELSKQATIKTWQRGSKQGYGS